MYDLWLWVCIKYMNVFNVNKTNLYCKLNGVCMEQQVEGVMIYQGKDSKVRKVISTKRELSKSIRRVLHGYLRSQKIDTSAKEIVHESKKKKLHRIFMSNLCSPLFSEKKSRKSEYKITRELFAIHHHYSGRSLLAKKSEFFLAGSDPQNSPEP